MKPGPTPKRFRGRPSGRRHSHGLNSNYESNGPSVKVKGSASQVHDRYEALSRDALASGDRIAAENYLQHAEHYQRIINAHLATQASYAEANGSGQPQRTEEDTERRPRRHRHRNSAPSQAPAPQPAQEETKT